MMRIKLLTTLTFVVLLFPGCYDDSKNAIVRINLDNMPIAKQVEKKSLIDKVFSVFVKDAFAESISGYYGVMKIHLAAYKDGSLIAKESLDTTGMDSTGNIVEFDVPAGNDITILVIGQTQGYDLNDNQINIAEYYGFSTVDLKQGAVNDVAVKVYTATSPQTMVGGQSWSIQLNFAFIPATSSLSWNKIGLPVKYQIVKNSDSVETVIYQGSEAKTIEITELPIGCGTSYNLYLIFEPFIIKSDGSFLVTGCT